MTQAGPGARAATPGAADRQAAGTPALPPHLAALALVLIERGIGHARSANGGIPQMPDLSDLRERLRTLARSESGRAAATLASVPSVHGWLTAGEAAGVMGVSPRQVRRLANGGQIIARRHGWAWSVDRDAAHGYRSSRKAA